MWLITQSLNFLQQKGRNGQYQAVKGTPKTATGEASTNGIFMIAEKSMK